MIDTNSIDRIIGSDVYDNDGDKIGSASEVFLDDQSGNPEWVTVKTGLFGTKSTFVPLRDAQLSGDGLRVPVSKEAVKDAPKVDADEHLSPEEEQQLYRHYGFDGTTTTTTTDTTQARTTADRGTVAQDTSGSNTDGAMTRSEERLRVGTEATEVGKARLRKHVVTENVTKTVPVSHEEVRIEREPITDANRGAATDGPALSDEEAEVTLHAERAVVDKETVPVERVSLGTETVTEQQQVTEQVAHEEIEQVTDDPNGRGTAR